MCSDGDQFDGYVEWGLVLSVSDGSLAHALGRLLTVMAVRFVCKWALCCLHGMLCVFFPLFLSDEGLLTENSFAFLCFLSNLYGSHAIWLFLDSGVVCHILRIHFMNYDLVVSSPLSTFQCT